MKIFIVSLNEDYEGGSPRAVFSDLNEAKKYVEHQYNFNGWATEKTTHSHECMFFRIDEFNLDEFATGLKND